MASIVETKAVALRRGNHAENMAFTGVQAEVSVDLGYEDKDNNLGTDVNTTLRLHNGITKGGIPMARADMLNVSAELLAENRQIINDKNLAYADISNIETTTNVVAQNKIVDTLKSYGLAKESEVQTRLDNKVDLTTTNLNTRYLASDEIHNGNNPEKPGDYSLAYANTSNINTANLTSPSYHSGTDAEKPGDYPLAYANLSNVNTQEITLSEDVRSERISGPVISRADMSNVNTTNLTVAENERIELDLPDITGPALAKRDLSNVPSSVFENIFNDVDTYGLEKVSNKDSYINESNPIAGHYPTSSAVIDFVNGRISSTDGNYANTSLTNVRNWDVLYTTSGSAIYERTATVTNSQDTFELNKSYDTNIYLVDDEKDTLWVQVTQVDSSGAISNGGISIRKNVGSVDLTNENPFIITSDTNVNATFTLTSTNNGNGTYTYSLNNIISSGSGFHIEDSTHDGEYVVKSSVTQNTYKVICNPLKIVPTELSESTGAIVSAKCEPAYGFTVVGSTQTPVTTTITSASNKTATISIVSEEYNRAGGAGVAKIDFTNLTGMTPTDQSEEANSPWRIRHNEDLPSLSLNNISNDQNYTIATNGAVWRALKTIFSYISTSFSSQFTSNSSYSSDPSTVSMLDGGSVIGTGNNYSLLPNHNYQFKISYSNKDDFYNFTTGNIGTSKTINYSVALITFDIDVADTTLTITRTLDSGVKTETISGTNGTVLITNNCTYTVSKSGYTDSTGSISVSSGDQTINVTLTPNV